jgi:hypothetical protein
MNSDFLSSLSPSYQRFISFSRTWLQANGQILFPSLFISGPSLQVRALILNKEFDVAHREASNARQKFGNSQQIYQVHHLPFP